MSVKRLSVLALAAAMTASLAVPALAEEAPIESEPLLIAPAPISAELPEEVDAPIPDRYTAAVTVNGQAITDVTYEESLPDTWETVEVTMTVDSLPGAPAGYVPMRLLCGADKKGSAYWYRGDNMASFRFANTAISVAFSDMSVEVGGVKVEGAKAYVSQGVTFLPVSCLAGIEGLTIDDHPEMSTEHYDFTITVSPIRALVDSIMEATEFAGGMETGMDGLDYKGIDPEDIIQAAGVDTFNTTPDTIVVAQVKEGAMDRVKEALEGYRQAQEDTFSWYLSWNLPKCQNAKIVSEGDFVLLFIGENEDKAVEVFQAGVSALAEASQAQ